MKPLHTLAGILVLAACRTSPPTTETKDAVLVTASEEKILFHLSQDQAGETWKLFRGVCSSGVQPTRQRCSEHASAADWDLVKETVLTKFRAKLESDEQRAEELATRLLQIDLRLVDFTQDPTVSPEEGELEQAVLGARLSVAEVAQTLRVLQEEITAIGEPNDPSLRAQLKSMKSEEVGLKIKLIDARRVLLDLDNQFIVSRRNSGANQSELAIGLARQFEALSEQYESHEAKVSNLLKQMAAIDDIEGVLKELFVWEMDQSENLFPNMMAVLVTVNEALTQITGELATPPQPVRLAAGQYLTGGQLYPFNDWAPYCRKLEMTPTYMGEKLHSISVRFAEPCNAASWRGRELGTTFEIPCDETGTVCRFNFQSRLGRSQHQMCFAEVFNFRTDGFDLRFEDHRPAIGTCMAQNGETNMVATYTHAN